MSPGLRLAWLVIASVIAVAGLGIALNASPDGQPVVSPTALLVYLPVVVLVGVASYLLHRRAPGTPSGSAVPRALIDTLLAAAVGGPALLVVVAVGTTIRDCATGSGC